MEAKLSTTESVTLQGRLSDEISKPKIKPWVLPWKKERSDVSVSEYFRSYRCLEMDFQ
jgi:hypothetical protein